MAAVSRGKFRATARQSKIRGWIIEIWEDGVTSPVQIVECAGRPTYTEKKAALDALISRRNDVQKESWSSEDAAEARRLIERARRSLALQGKREPSSD